LKKLSEDQHSSLLGSAASDVEKSLVTPPLGQSVCYGIMINFPFLISKNCT